MIMNALIKLVMFIIAAGGLPVLTGLLPVSLLPAKERRLPILIVSGYLSTFALFELVGVPILIWTPMGDFALLVKVFLGADLLWIAAGGIVVWKSGGLHLPDWMMSGKRRILDPDAVFWWGVFGLLLAAQLYMSYTRASYDGDDAYYVAQSLQTWQTGTMYYYVPYTGVTTSLDGRHALAMMPMWIAFVARLCGTHSTIVTHSMMPLVLLPLVDVVFYELFRNLIQDKTPSRQQQLLPAMMICLSVLQIFGNTSIYTAETFLLMRTWQGKSMCANFILPCLLLLLFRKICFEKEESRWCWCMLSILGLAAGFCTSLAPVLVSGALLLAALLIRIIYKKKRILLAAAVSCIPAGIYMIFLLRMIYPALVPFLKGGRLP